MADCWRLEVRVQPRARHNRVVGRHGEAIKVQVSAPPAANAANEALIELLAATLGVPRRAVRIARGAASRNKLVEIETVDLAACQSRLQQVLADCIDKKQSRD